MPIPSRTPDGWPSVCPTCGNDVTIAPSPGALDAPCPYCGHLLWFGNTGAGLICVIADTASELVVAVTEDFDLEYIDKLQFVLNREVQVVVKDREWILRQIAERYGDDPSSHGCGGNRQEKQAHARIA